MSGKAPLPSLTGHRLKTRKRDEKKQYDPLGFRDAIFEGLTESKGDLESVFRYLDAAGSKLDYRRYGVNLIEILISGGLLAPGGLYVEDGDPPHKTATCLFELVQPGDLEGLKAFDQNLFVKLMRRYKYLEKMHEEEMNKILVYLKGFSSDQRTILAQITALWLSSGQLPATLLPILIHEHQVKDGTALEFLLEILSTLKSEKGGPAVINIIKKSGMEANLMAFFPAHNQSQTKEHFAKTFSARDLPEVVAFKKQVEEQRLRSLVQKQLKTAIMEEKPSKEVVEFLKKNKIPECDSIVMIWSCVMTAIEWSKKEDLLQDQALRHVRKHVPLFKAFSSNNKSELALINKIQEFCYDNMNFLKIFNKIIVLLYKTDVLSEDVILKWYREGHSQRGWSVFMDQIKKFIEWLEKAEEGRRSMDDDEEEGLFGGNGFHPWTLSSPLFVTLKTHVSVGTLGQYLKLPPDLQTETVLSELLRVVAPGPIQDPNEAHRLWNLLSHKGFSMEEKDLAQRLAYFFSGFAFVQKSLRQTLFDLLSCSPPTDLFMFKLISSSPDWFTEFIWHILSSLGALSYDGALLGGLPGVIERIHSASESPLSLYPPHLQELVSYIFLISADEDLEEAESPIEFRIIIIIEELLISDSFDLKILILLFPLAFKRLLYRPSFEFLLCLLPMDGALICQCLAV